MKLVLCEKCDKFKSLGAYDYAFEDCCWDCKEKDKKLSRLELIFDSDEARHSFYSNVLDCNILDHLDLNTEFKGSSDWTKGDYTKLRLTGTGDPVDEYGNIIE